MKKKHIPVREMTFKVKSTKDIEQVVKYIEALKKGDSTYKPVLKPEDKKSK